MDLPYIENDEEDEYICQSELNSNNVYVYMAPQVSTNPETQTRAVSYLEIIPEKKEHVYEYIEYSTAKQKKKFEFSKYSKVIKRTLLSICVLLGIVALLVLVIFLIRLMDRWQREKTMKDSGDEAGKEESSQSEITFRLNITLPGDRANFVRNMTKEAWNAYVQHAWGSGALKPLTKEGDDSTTVGETIVTSMSTLWVMEMYEEFERGKQWVERELHRLKNTTVDVLVYVIIVNYLGGLLSCFALTGDELFLNKSFEITDMLLPVLNFSAGNESYIMPPSINLQSGNLSGTANYLSFLGHRQLEMLYFIQLSGEPLFIEYINCISALVEKLPKHNGLYFEKYYCANKWHSSTSSLNMHSREFYYNLIRAYIHSGGRDLYSYVQYASAINAADQANMFGRSNQSGLLYARALDINGGVHQKWSSGSSCYLGAMLALSVGALKSRHLKSITESLSSREKPLLNQQNLDRQWKLALELTETCHQAAIRTRTGLLPQRFIFTQHEEATTALVTVGILTPELAESYFILWRLTHNGKYREYAWQLVMAIYEHCRTDSGYAQVQNVNRVPTIKNNVQLPVFLSATLKYLFLIFTDDSVLPIDQWVFSAAGHPFPIFGNISDNG